VGNFKQKDRPIAIETPLGEDKLVLGSFTGEERLSGLFSFSLSMISEDGGIKPKDIVGKPVDFFVRLPDGKERWFNGIVNSFHYTGKDDRAFNYKASVVPWLWLLTRGSDCRVHECNGQKDVKEIINGLLGDLGFSDYKWDLKRTLGKREYCVQYRETHFDFFSRLLEEEGVYYYFKHEKGKHLLVLTDHIDGVYDCPDAEVRMMTNLSQPESTDNLRAWSHDYEFTSGKWTHTDYDFENPTTSLLSESKSKVSLTGNSSLEFYDFPGDYVDKGLGGDLLKLRMEEEEAAYNTASGRSICHTFSPGARFTLTKHHDKSEAGGKWVITAVEHHASQGGNYFSGAAHSDEIYQNSFRAMPSDVVFRPPRVRSKPRLMGIQSALVVGPSGEEIYTDKYGRIKVQFPWDRKGKKDDKSSLWIRVATPWAGKQWGMIHIPRIGNEVIVSFLDGDPDRPVVTGMLYNADHMPPYGLPDNMTQSGIKTHSSKEGSDENFNEIRFEDKKGSEEIYIHAEQDLNCVIENNETRKVGFDDKKDGDQSIEIFNNQILKVGTAECKDGSQTVEIYKDRSVTLKTGNDSLMIEKGNQDTTLKMGNQTTTLDMGNSELILKMGNQTTKINLGKSTTEAMQSIEMKVMGSSIKIDGMGITIKSPVIKIEALGTAELKSPLTTVKGDAMLMMKGGITMIN
jgi:type VI secretion system secreted protein VgrG